MAMREHYSLIISRFSSDIPSKKRAIPGFVSHDCYQVVAGLLKFDIDKKVRYSSNRRTICRCLPVREDYSDISRTSVLYTLTFLMQIYYYCRRLTPSLCMQDDVIEKKFSILNDVLQISPITISVLSAE